ncbi:MAG: hypothetical protein ACOVNS_13165 [Erythrobacter sp.]
MRGAKHRDRKVGIRAARPKGPEFCFGGRLHMPSNTAIKHLPFNPKATPLRGWKGSKPG